MLPRGSAIFLATCRLTNAVLMVKRRGTLQAPSSRTRPARRIFPLLILFIDLLSSKLETSQVVEVHIFRLTDTPPAHVPICSRYSGCPAPIVPLFLPRQLMANVGPQMYSRLPSTQPQMPVPSHPPRAYIITPTSRPFLMCSGLMVVGHRLDCYSLLSVVFAVFHGHSGHGSLAQDIFSLFALILSMRTPPTRPPCGALLVRTSLFVVSSQSLAPL